MKTAIVHGALLLLMMIYGYRTWTRDKSVTPDVGSVALWERSSDDLQFVEYKTENKLVRLEKRTDTGGAYWWGLETTTTKRPKPVTTPPASTPATPATPPADPTKPADATKPADPAKPADAAAKPADPAKPAEAAATPPTPPPPAEPEMEEVKTVTEFPGGESVDILVKLLGSAKALRSLGTVSEADKKTYKLDDSKTVLTVGFRDGQRVFVVGGQVYGGADRYVLEQSTGKGYVLSREMLAGLDSGFTALRLGDPRGFDVTTVEQVTISANGKSRAALRVTAPATADSVAATKTWGDADSKKADQALANFIDNSFNMVPTNFEPALKQSDLTPVLTMAYRDVKGNALGDLKLFKRTRAAELPADGTGDPANPPPPLVEYFILTPKTRVLALVNRSIAERAEQDLGTVFPAK